MFAELHGVEGLATRTEWLAKKGHGAVGWAKIEALAIAYNKLANYYNVDVHEVVIHEEATIPHDGDIALTAAVWKES